MHGSTETMVNRLITALEAKGIKAYKFDLTVADTGKLAITLLMLQALSLQRLPF